MTRSSKPRAVRATASPSPVHSPGLEIALADVTPVSVSWINVAVLGEFKGHSQGAFAFTEETFAQIVKNFRANSNGRIPVDWEHASETLDGNVSQQGAPAPAWITDLEVRDDRLYAQFEWVDSKAVEYVRTGQYRWVSPAVVFDATDPKSGEKVGARLTSVALTNHPFLRDLIPLAASETVASEPPAFEPLPTATRADADAVRASLGPDAVHIPTAIGSSPPRRSPMADEQTEDKFSALMKRLRSAIGMAEDADEESMMSELEKQLGEYGSMKTAKAAAMRADAEHDVDARIACGIIQQTGRAFAIKLRLDAPEQFTQLFATPPQALKTPVTPVTPASPPGVPADLGALLTGRIAPQGGAPVAPVNSGDHSALADQRARKMRAADKDLSYEAALLAASRELNDEQKIATLRRLVAVQGQG